MSIADRSYKIDTKKTGTGTTNTDRSFTSKTSKQTNDGGGGGGGGYELVSPRKKPKAVDGGYEIPGKRPVTGYELVKTPGSKQNRPSSPDVSYVAFAEKKPPPKKTDLALIVAVIVIFIIAAIGLGFALYNYIKSTEIEKPPLPDLTELCRSAQTNPQFDRSCYYHKKKYPSSCKKSTYCASIGFNIGLKSDMPLRLKVESIEDIVVDKIMNIPDETPCNPGQWCQKGQCVKTDDERVKKYDAAAQVNGEWRVTCGNSLESMCINVADSARFVVENAGVCLKDVCTLQKGNEERYEFGFTFRVCDNPLPKYGGAACWDAQGEDQSPLEMTIFCGPCTKSFANDTQRYSCSHNNTDGRPCKTNLELNLLGRKGLCYSGICVVDNNNECPNKEDAGEESLLLFQLVITCFAQLLVNIVSNCTRVTN